jgi:hypothetical protein
METVKDKPEWLTELAAENNLELRRQIVQTIRRHCWETGRRYQDVWHSVYHQFESNTGISFRECSGAKIDFVGEKGRLSDLLRAATNVINPDVEETIWPWGRDEDE